MQTTQSNRSIALGQQFVIQARRDATANGLPPLGSRREIAEQLTRFNTGTDGSDQDVLHGPGIRIDFPPAENESGPVNQMLLTINEEEIGWLVVQRLAREFHWTIVDAATGREWNP